MQTKKSIPYEYQHLSIPGGGYVTGIFYSQSELDVLYARTDIGGCYGFDAKRQKWISLCDHVNILDMREAYPIALAENLQQQGSLYVACGSFTGNGLLAVSKDHGKSFHYENIPARIHGNFPGRGAGERLAVIREHIYFASQMDGLLRSSDEGKTWQKIFSLEEDYLTFVHVFSHTLLVGTAGVSQGTKKHRGHSLYVSYDEGRSFEPVEEPESLAYELSDYGGLVAQRCCRDEQYLYVTFSASGRKGFRKELSYSCDCGELSEGRIVRYAIEKNGCLGDMTDITPGFSSPVQGKSWQDEKKELCKGLGYSGISVSRQTKGLLLAATMVRKKGDCVLLSRDYGQSWKQLLYGTKEGKVIYRTSYLQPRYNGGRSFLHWMSDVQINPFNDEEAWLNTGTGVFRTRNLKQKDCFFQDWCDGIEETVHLNVYSLSRGKTRVLDMVGDLGGFAFGSDYQTPENSFEDGRGNRYITCINADFQDEDPRKIVVAARGNWSGKTKGGLILSEDYGQTFRRFKTPFGLSKKLDTQLKHIESPNVNPGFVAMSPDGKNLVWTLAERERLPVDFVLCSQDGGKTFAKSSVWQRDGLEKEEGCLKVFSDRRESHIFYGYGENSDLYVSLDKGMNFEEVSLLNEDFPLVDFGCIDGADRNKVCPVPYQSGNFYLGLGKEGLWKICFSPEKRQAEAVRITKDGDAVYCVGLGKGESENGKTDQAIYCNGVLDGVYGFYRSLDDGQSFVRINTDKQMYGQIGAIAGDAREFGVFYIATRTRGLLRGTPSLNKFD